MESGSSKSISTKRVCFVCGGSGSSVCLVTCHLCGITSEHVFCRRKLLIPIPKVWFCDDCVENNPPDVVKEDCPLDSEESRLMVTFESESVYRVVPSNIEKFFEEHQSPLKCSVGAKSKKRCATNDKRDEVNDRFCAGHPPATQRGSRQPTNLLMSYMGLNLNSITNPISARCWEGTFEVSDAKLNSSFGIQAHYSYLLHHKVVDIQEKMNANLKFSVKPRLSVWPEMFQLKTPSHFDIAMYFFSAENLRSKEKYPQLMEYIDLNDWALHTWVDDAELIIYSSKLLAADCPGIDINMFLWGVFRKVNSKHLNILHSAAKRRNHGCVAR